MGSGIRKGAGKKSSQDVIGRGDWEGVEFGDKRVVEGVHGEQMIE